MQKIFSNPSDLEKFIKNEYSIPDFLMMENAANAMANFILQQRDLLNNNKSMPTVLIICGKGNNGGDGYALARLLQNKCKISIFCIEPPSAKEAQTQYEICKKLDIKIIYASNNEDLKNFKQNCSKADFIVDCIYGTGFHGILEDSIKSIIDIANKTNAIKIACDIPSALYFKSDYTITMGEQKLSLFSDKAKAICGHIFVEEIGFDRNIFESEDFFTKYSNSNALLVEETDINLPFRKNKSAHKGTYGHTIIFAGQKSGAAILAATAAMNFGSGLTTLIKNSDLSQFKISPSLMISDSIPKKATCIVAGPGFTVFSDNISQQIINWFQNTNNPAAVFDAGIISASNFPDFLTKLNQFNNARIVITPHLAELSRFLNVLKNSDSYKSFFADFSDEDIEVKSLAENPEIKIKIGHLLNKLFPRTAVIMKSANTFICADNHCFIIDKGPQSLAKGGSGDILAGMTAALLSQGYSAKDASITATFHHAITARNLGVDAYNLTPEKLIANI